MTSYRALLDDATQLLYNTCDTPRIDAEVLLQHAIKHDLAWLIAHNDSTASGEHIKQFYTLIEQRQQGQPIAYITGTKSFWTLDLAVNQHVLIPRGDTETLVEQALLKIDNSASINILDLGTGSGAIALAIAKECPKANLTAVDQSTEALAVAQCNAQSNNIENVRFIQSNWFENLNDQSFDIIVSNPPYVAQDDKHLQQGDLRFEPIGALASEQKGLADLDTIISQANDYLSDHGWLMLEHGYDQQQPVADLLKQYGLKDIQCQYDINNLPRVSFGQKAL